MSSDEEQVPAGIAAMLERRDRQAERRETLMMAMQVAIAAVAAASLILWAFGRPPFGAAWAVIAGTQAVAMIYAQRTIRLWRRHAKFLRRQVDQAYDLLRMIRR